MKTTKMLKTITLSLMVLAFVDVRASFTVASSDTTWVDSVFNSLTPEERIAQLFIIRAFSDRDSAYSDSLARLIIKWNPGGICFFKGTPFRQASITNDLQGLAATPLLVACDAEYGLGMRLDSTVSFPRAMALGAINDDSLIEAEGECIGRDCKRLGVNMNFAPVVDINNNPLNPVIGFRSFGENPAEVARRSMIFMKGMQSQGIICTAKHFPGHGDTDTDSHLSLPVLIQSQERMDSVELLPFREAIRNGVDGVMTGHLYVPELDSTENTPASLSSEIINRLLKEKMGFKGFVITDALDMKGVTMHTAPGRTEVSAINAGNDFLLLPRNLDDAIDSIKLACDSSRIPWEVINEKCRKMLALKYKAGLSHYSRIPTGNLYSDLNPAGSVVLSKMIWRKAVTVVKNNNDIIPVRFLDRRKIGVIFIGDMVEQYFQRTIAKYAQVKLLNLASSFTLQEMDSAIAEMRNTDLVIIGVRCNQGLITKNYGVHDCTLDLIDSLSNTRKVILDIFGSPYTLALIRHPENLEGILASYQDITGSQIVSAGLIMGATPAEGHLPVTAAPSFPYKTGINTSKTRLEYVLPEEVGISEVKLKKIDSIIVSGIDRKAYPGCQVEFAINGKVFYNKSFGHPEYNDTIPVNNSDIYDLASVTKVAATTMAVMKLTGEGKINPDEKLDYYLPELHGSNKGNLVIRDVMSHQAGLQSWIPFYITTLKNGGPDTSIYHDHPSDEYPLRVAEGLYIRKDYPDSILMSIARSPLRAVRDYKYSDVGFYLLRLIVEKQAGKSLEDYMEITFYKPLGLSTMGYRPLSRFPLNRIMPTENDTVFRKQLIRGDVHDPGAAMLGGISGHAGLFSNAEDLTVLLQLLLNDGEYGGKQYLLPSTVREFTKVQFPAKGNRRALGFDKPALPGVTESPCCNSASSESFGHSGFTGTYCWADPENQLTYVFLSNRVYPDVSNEKIVEMNIRTRVHQAMYDILKTAYMRK